MPIVAQLLQLLQVLGEIPSQGRDFICFSQCLCFLQVLLYSVDSLVSALDQDTG